MFAWPQNLRVASNHVTIALLHYLKKKRVHHHNFSLIYLPLWILKCIFLMKYIHYVCKMRFKCKTNSVPLTALCSLTISTSKRKNDMFGKYCALCEGKEESTYEDQNSSGPDCILTVFFHLGPHNIWETYFRTFCFASTRQKIIAFLKMEPTRAAVPWNPSSKWASGWLVGLLWFWYWTKEGLVR